MATINPWINFNGNAEIAFEFYRSVFGGNIEKVLDPNSELMLIKLPIGKDNKLIANNVPEFMGRVNEKENRSKIAISTESKEEADRLFNGLSVGGTVEMPMAESPWGTYFGMFRDKYGIEWTVEFNS